MMKIPVFKEIFEAPRIVGSDSGSSWKMRFLLAIFALLLIGGRSVATALESLGRKCLTEDYIMIREDECDTICDDLYGYGGYCRGRYCKCFPDPIETNAL